MRILRNRRSSPRSREAWHELAIAGETRSGPAIMSNVSTIAPRRWWGEAWVGLTETVGPAGARATQRGQALARRGAVESLQFAPGLITATVQEERGEPTVELRCEVAEPDVWKAAVAVLGDELRFTAALMEGELPEGVDEALADVGFRLIPTWGELQISCSCESREALCRHVAAVHAAAAVAIDRDPFLLFRLRGGERSALLRAIREHRGSGTQPGPAAGVVDLSVGMSEARGDLEAIVLHPALDDDPSGLVRQLGPPPGVDDDEPVLALIERAARAAWRLAAGDGSKAADQELLLAELRAQRVATPDSLGEALGRDPGELREELDRLFEDGQVMRTGSGKRARYRAGATPA